MHLYPAIDLLDGRCVRLYQGDYSRSTVYGEDPVAQALAFQSEGAPWVHVVDLDAARTGEPRNREVVAAIAGALDVPVQTGGGVRSAEAAEALFDAGVARVVLGTAALEDPDLVRRIAETRSVAVGLDARGSEVAVRGWLEGSGADVIDLAIAYQDAGVAALVVTEISRDGTLAGPDVDGLSRVLAATTIPVIASGGIGTLDDITTLAGLSVEGRSLDGAITGRAVYEGAFTVAEAVAASAGDQGPAETRGARR